LISLVVPCAGTGQRFVQSVPGTGKIKKHLSPIKGIPVFLHTLSRFKTFPEISEVILVINKDDEAEFNKWLAKDILDTCGLEYAGRCPDPAHQHTYTGKPVYTVYGGTNRFDSVYRGLCACTELPYVFIHDAVRPLIHPRNIQMLISLIQEKKTAILATEPQINSLKKINACDMVIENIPRHSVVSASTPQCFPHRKILDAYNAFLKDFQNKKNTDADIPTDDAEIYLRYGGQIMVCELTHPNLKLTRYEDLKYIENFL